MHSFFEYEPCDSGNLFILFSELGLQLGMLMFEFKGALKDISVNKLFFKGQNLSWHLSPVEEWGADIHEKVDFIHSYVDKCNAKKVFLLGTSAGGMHL